MSPTILGSTPHRSAQWTIGAIALALLSYTVVRGITVSFTWDETWTYIHHVSKGMFYQRAYDKMGGNHHLLNVWGMWACMKMFGTSELALRLPNLLAHVLYLYATVRIALKARYAFLAVTCFLLMNVHPYLLDFFSLARGYGLAVGFMMMCLWQVVRYFDEGQRPVGVWRAMLFAGLSALSHVIMINFLLAVGLAFVIIWCAQARRTGWAVRRPHAAALFTCATVALIIILPNALGLFGGGSLNFGCDTFWTCMVGTLGAKVLYHVPYTTPVLMLVACALVVALLWCSITWITAIRQGWADRLRPFGFAALVLAGSLLSVLSQHFLFDVPLPQSRTGLFLLPLLAFIVAGCCGAWPRTGAVPITASVLLCIPLIAHQKNSFNTQYAVEWKPSGELAHMLRIIADDHPALTRQRPIITVGSSFESWGCLPYYQRTRNMEWMVGFARWVPEPYPRCDYYIVEYDGHDQVDTAHWSMLYRSEATNTTLYRDERWRDPLPPAIHMEREDMESVELPGRSSLQHVSGAHSVRFDTLTRGLQPLEWVVPPGEEASVSTLSGTAMVLQYDDANWVGFNMDVLRGDTAIAHVDVASEKQVPTFGQWAEVGVVLHPSIPLKPGDVVRLTAVPLSAAPAIFLDDLELRVLP